MVSSTCRGLGLVGLAGFMLLSGCSSPRKEMVVEQVAIPKGESGSETYTAFTIYYVWDGKKDEYPWWFVVKMPLGDPEGIWVVGEMRNRHPDDDELMKIQKETRPLSASWLDDGFSHLRRTPGEKVQHALFGSDALPVERKAIAEVVRLTQTVDAHSVTPGTGNSGDATRNY